MEYTKEVAMLKKFHDEHNDWSYERMAVSIGVHSRAIFKWFRGSNTPNRLSRQAITRFLIENNYMG